MLKIMMGVVMLAVLVMADAPVVKTGQTTQYKVGDDGTYQSGITRSYTRDNANGIVTDNATGLQWQDNAVGSTMNHAAAITHCTNLSLDGGAWRLPTIEELVSITDKSRTNPSIDPTFQSVISSVYWSSTTNASDSDYAWVVNFYRGNDLWYGKSVIRYVRCVRSGQ